MVTNVTLKTRTKTGSRSYDDRNVTISYSSSMDEIRLLGMLQHNTELIIDQQLIDGLQRIHDKRKANTL
jgi:hypothetical protein